MSLETVIRNLCDDGAFKANKRSALIEALSAETAGRAEDGDDHIFALKAPTGEYQIALVSKDFDLACFFYIPEAELWSYSAEIKHAVSLLA